VIPELPELPEDQKIKPNVYVNPSEAIAPNGRYLIQFKVVKIKDRGENGESEKLGEMNDNLNLDSQRIKKDALYKPLLRKFRAFLRKIFDGLGLGKGLHNSNGTTVNQLKLFAQKIKLPD
jgi:hypothetical protein